jgi:pSer/pThr/pTyr-binding forkhead associated (FHA) protein
MTEIVNSLVILKKKGQDGMSVDLPATCEDVTFGRGEECNIRIAKSSVSSLHARIFFDNKQMVGARSEIFKLFLLTATFFFFFFFLNSSQPMIENLSKTNYTTLNGSTITTAVHLHDGDEILISERAFRFVSNRPKPAVRTPLVPKKTKSVKSSPAPAIASENDVPNATKNNKASAVKAKLDAEAAKAKAEAEAVAAAAAAAAAAKEAEEQAAAEAAAAAAKKAAEFKAARARSNSLTKVEMKARTDDEPIPALATASGVATPKRKQKRHIAKTPKKPLTTMAPELQGDIVERALKPKSVVYGKPEPPLATPMRKSIISKAVARPAAHEMKSMATPMKKSIKQHEGKHSAMYDMKSMATPVKTSIKKHNATHAAVYDMKSLATPVRNGIASEGAVASEQNAEKFARPEHTLQTPVRKSIPTAAAAFNDRNVYGAKPKLDTPVKQAIAVNATKLVEAREARVAAEAAAAKAKAEAEAAAAAAKAKADAEAKAAAEAAAAALKAAEEEAAQKVKAEAEQKARLEAAEAAAKAEEEAERVAAVAAAAAAAEAADAAAAAEAENADDDDDDEDDDDDDIQVNMPKRAVSQSGMTTPVRSKAGSKSPNGRSRVMFVNEHTTGTPMRDALIAAATPIAGSAVSSAPGMPKNLQLSIGAAATDAAIRRAVAAQKSMVASIDNGANDDAEAVIRKAPEEQPFKLFTVDVDSAAKSVEQQLSALEEKMSGKCTKAQLEDAVRSAVASIRDIVAHLSDAGAAVASDVVEKCIAINAVAEEQMAAQAEVQAVVESEVAAEPAEPVAEVKKPAARGRGRKSTAAEKPVEVAEPVVEEEQKPATPAKSTRSRKSAAAEAEPVVVEEKATSRRTRKSAVHAEPEPEVVEEKAAEPETRRTARGRAARK